MSRRSLRILDIVIVGLVVAGLIATAVVRLRPGRPVLTVWSCGGNYDFLKAYAAQFEKRWNCRVRYTAAPVQYLLEQAVFGSSVPDVIVGRAGPGWVALEHSGKLLDGPVFFAIDPFGIAVPKGNPKRIRSVADVGRPGVRVVASPRAMRPKGKVVGLIMAQLDKAYPGLVERWENNAVVRPKCGRFLVGPLIRGEADCAVVPRSVCFYPPVRGKVEFIPIPPKFLLGLKKGRASMPQCAGVLRSAGIATRRDLARRFVYGLRDARDLLHEYGYLALDDAEAAPLKGLLKLSVPKYMEAWQVRLAEYLEEYGILHEAHRRYLKVVYTFGPNHFTARALFRAAKICLGWGKKAAARLDLDRVVNEYPAPRPNEYDSRVLHCCGREVSGVEPQPYSYWIVEAQKLLREVRGRGDPRAGSRVLRDPRVHALFPVLVHEGDPPKNGKREFGLGLHLMTAEDFDFATRDLLKVCTLNYPSRWRADAEYLLGVCALYRGFPALAREQWQRVVAEFPQSRAAAAARIALVEHPAGGRAAEGGPGLPQMPAAPERLDAHPLRGITYGMRLWHHRLPLFTFKEMTKVVSGVYGPAPPEVQAEARFRQGVALLALGHPEGAARAWRICRTVAPDSRWARLAEERLAGLKASGGSGTSNRQGSRHAGAGPGRPGGSGEKKKGSFVVRFRIAEEFRLGGVYEGDQIILEYLKVLTVARPPKGKGGNILAAAAFHLAGALEHTGRKAAAREWFEKVVARYPGSPWAAKARAALAGKAGTRGRTAPAPGTTAGSSRKAPPQ